MISIWVEWTRHYGRSTMDRRTDQLQPRRALASEELVGQFIRLSAIVLYTRQLPTLATRAEQSAAHAVG